MRKATGVLLLIGLLWSNVSYGQDAATESDDQSEYTELQQVLNKLRGEVENIPHTINRIATQSIKYDSTRLTEQGYKLIVHQVEEVFRDNGRTKVLSLEEFRRKKVLHVTGTDSTLTLRNTMRSPNERENNLRLLELSQRYGIDAFMKGNIQYRDDVGYVIMLELISPQSREVIWSKSLVSKDMDPPEKPSGGKSTLVTAGASLMPTSQYMVNGNIYGGDIMLLDYSGHLVFRQAINSKNSGYIGIRGGYHYYNVVPKGDEMSGFEPYNVSIYEAGAIFYYSLAEKAESKNDYWLELYAGPNMLLISNARNQFGLAQGININISNNLGLALDAQYLFMESPQIENEDQTRNIQLNTIGYGLKVLLRL